MRDVELVSQETLEEVIHHQQRTELVLQQLRLPACEAHPPLAIEHGAPPGGATRPPVVLVHGFAQNRYTWRLSQRSLVGALVAQGHPVLNVELRGHGRSREYGADGAGAFADYVEDLVRVVERLDTPPFLVGHSLGGAVCTATATRVPVRGLVPIAGVYTFACGNPVLRALGHVSLSAEPVLKAMHLRTAALGHLLGRLYAVSDVAGFGFPISGWAPGSHEPELLEERLRLGFDWTPVEIWLQMCRWATTQRFDYAEAFQALDTPLLCLAGDLDVLVTPKEARAQFEDSGSTDRQLVVFEPFENQVHWGHVDLITGSKAPEEVWPVLLSWLEAHSG